MGLILFVLVTLLAVTALAITVLAARNGLVVVDEQPAQDPTAHRDQR
jgi:Tfp pilus assembly protein PilX